MLTMTRPATAVRTVSRDVPRPAPRVRRYPLVEPTGLAGWREHAAQRVAGSQIGVEQVRAVLAGVRGAAARDQVATVSGLSTEQVMNVVAGIGSRLGQSVKGGPRATSCMSAAKGAKLGLAPGVHLLDTHTVVVLAADWARTRKHPRDVARSYAAIAMSDSSNDDTVLERWLSSVQDEAEVTYQHLAHLYAVSRGTFATLDGISTDLNVQAAYLKGYDTLVSAIHGAQQHLATLLSDGAAPDQCLTALRGCFWLCGPVARQLGGNARAALEGHTGAEQALHSGRARLRASVERQPRQYFPRSIGELTSTQFRALCAGLGFPVPLDDDGTTDETGQRALIAALSSAKLRRAAA